MPFGAQFHESEKRVAPCGELSWRRRREPALGIDVLGIKLGDEFRMSSHFTASEVELGRLGVAECAGAECAGSGLDVVVGGLGLGYTAQAVLESQAVASLLVVAALEAVIDWHRARKSGV